MRRASAEEVVRLKWFVKDVVVGRRAGVVPKSGNNAAVGGGSIGGGSYAPSRPYGGAFSGAARNVVRLLKEKKTQGLLRRETSTGCGVGVGRMWRQSSNVAASAPIRMRVGLDAGGQVMDGARGWMVGRAHGWAAVRNAVLGGGMVAGGVYWYIVNQEATCYSNVHDVVQRCRVQHDEHSTHMKSRMRGLLDRLQKELYLIQRLVYLTILFMPMAFLSPAVIWMDGRAKELWLRLMTWTLEKAGPAFLKWGQWAATRPDLFAPDVCKHLERLQTDAPTHDFSHTKEVVERAFGMPIEKIFARFDELPVASGSIAQIHRASLTAEGSARACNGERQRGLLSVVSKEGRFSSASRKRRESKCFATGMDVAVKVRHPGVNETMECDFELMNRAACILEKIFVGSVASAQLKESLMQFGAPMRDQLDLRAEAAYLDNFAENFKWWSQVRFPLPATTLVAEDVLVESFEEGEHISSYIGKTCPYNKKLADLGMTCYLKMLLKDNFIHADLHPGNILVRLDTPSPGSMLDTLSRHSGWKIEIPRIVLLDVGMTAKLSEDEQCNLINFFKSLSSLDGTQIADSILGFAEKVGDATAFKEDINGIFTALDPDHLRKNTQEVIAQMMDSVREHGVQIPGAVSTVVITTMVLEGWSSKLNPDIRILDSLRDVLPKAWDERMKQAIDKVIGNHVLALA